MHTHKQTNKHTHTHRRFHTAKLPSGTSDKETETNGIAHILLAPNAGETGHVVAVTHEHNFYSYDVATMEPERLLVGFNDDILHIQCLPDNERAVVATNSAQIRLIDLTSSNAEMLVGHADVVLSLVSVACKHNTRAKIPYERTHAHTHQTHTHSHTHRM